MSAPVFNKRKGNSSPIASRCETAIHDSGVMPFGKYTCLFSGYPSSEPTQFAHGVAICLNKQAASAWREVGPVWEAVSERIVYCRLRAHPANITLVSVYAPVNPQPGQTAAEAASDSFYDDCRGLLTKCPLVTCYSSWVNKRASEQTTAPIRLQRRWSLRSRSVEWERTATHWLLRSQRPRHHQHLLQTQACSPNDLDAPWHEGVAHAGLHTRQQKVSYIRWRCSCPPNLCWIHRNGSLSRLNEGKVTSPHSTKAHSSSSFQSTRQTRVVRSRSTATLPSRHPLHHRLSLASLVRQQTVSPIRRLAAASSLA